MTFRHIILQITIISLSRACPLHDLEQSMTKLISVAIIQMERDQNVTLNTNNFVWWCQTKSQSQSTKQRWVGFDGYEAHFFSFVYYWQHLHMET